MAELARLIADWIHYLWPLRRVKPYQKALYTVMGRWQWIIGPGIYPIVPWFCEVDAEAVSEGIVQTPRIDLTLKDGTQLSCAISGTVRVVDLLKAVNHVDAYMESAAELMVAVAGEKLAEVDAERLSPEKRKRLLSDLHRWIQAEAEAYGLEFRKVSFTSYVIAPRFYRLLSDNGSAQPW